MVRRSTWIALGAFAAVILSALILNQTQKEGPRPAATPPPDPLWTVQSADIVALIIEDLTAGYLLQFERHEEDLWRMVRPEQGEAEVASVERAVSWLSSPNPRAKLTEVEDLSDYRLDLPEYRVTLLLSNGEKLSLMVGRETPTGGSRYIALPGTEGVWIVSTLGLDEVLDLLQVPESSAKEAPNAQTHIRRPVT
ncbi:MAG: DUF4340 domain-containing protein [Anaerolineales bacterium]